MPNSVEVLTDVEADSSRETASTHVTGDVLDNTTKLMAAAMPPSEDMLIINEKTSCFSKLF